MDLSLITRIALSHVCIEDSYFKQYNIEISHPREFACLRLKTNTRKFSNTMVIYSVSINFG